MRAGCTGPCQQGRVTCPTPEACEIEEPNFYGRDCWKEMLLDASVAVGVAAIVIVVAAMLAGRA